MLKIRENALRLIACVLGVLVMVHGLRAQQPEPAAAGMLTIAGDITQRLSLTPADLKSMPRRRVEHKEKDQVRVYEGVLVSELQERASSWRTR